MDETAAALLDLVGRHDGLSLARAAKALQLSQSQLRRLLAALGPDTTIGGLDLIVVDDGEPARLHLTARAREHLERA
ncbi:hypothetical protein [Solimonas marina]|uniref:Uncharacterized protein n=1 Tax=Solimonas marina TaxID=2714601 RepID=A0A969WCP8_9GAMM|nr:hypothetical protein [Solimonas marina]NKF23598.1 hypothetical protein [Solimonas marina]